jgi:hypothetical protein
VESLARGCGYADLLLRQQRHVPRQ